MKKIVVFQLLHNTTSNQGKLGRFSSSVRRPKKAGEVTDYICQQAPTRGTLILRSSNLQIWARDLWHPSGGSLTI